MQNAPTGKLKMRTQVTSRKSASWWPTDRPTVHTRKRRTKQNEIAVHFSCLAFALQCVRFASLVSILDAESAKIRARHGTGRQGIQSKSKSAENIDWILHASKNSFEPESETVRTRVRLIIEMHIRHSQFASQNSAGIRNCEWIMNFLCTRPENARARPYVNCHYQNWKILSQIIRPSVCV